MIAVGGLHGTRISRGILAGEFADCVCRLRRRAGWKGPSVRRASMSFTPGRTAIGPGIQIDPIRRQRTLHKPAISELQYRTRSAIHGRTRAASAAAVRPARPADWDDFIGVECSTQSAPSDAAIQRKLTWKVSFSIGVCPRRPEMPETNPPCRQRSMARNRLRHSSTRTGPRSRPHRVIGRQTMRATSGMERTLPQSTPDQRPIRTLDACAHPRSSRTTGNWIPRRPSSRPGISPLCVNRKSARGTTPLERAR